MIRIICFLLLVHFQVSCGKHNSYLMKGNLSDSNENLGTEKQPPAEVVFDLCPDGETSESDRMAKLIDGQLKFHHQTNNLATQAETRTIFDDTVSTKCADAPDDAPNWVKTCADPNDEFSQGVGNFVTMEGCVFRINHDLDKKFYRAQRMIPRGSVDCKNIAGSNYSEKLKHARKPCRIGPMNQIYPDSERIYYY